MLIKKLMAFAVSALLVIAPIQLATTPQKAEAGIPTVDIASLLQNLLGYIQALSDYAEQLYQAEVAANQYISMLMEMEQIYREYEHTLSQIEGLASYFDQTTWETILQQVHIDFPLNPLDSHWDDWDVSIYTEDGVIDVDQRVGSVFDRIRDLDDVYETINTVYEPGPQRDYQLEKARRHYLRSREVTEQAYSTEVFKSSSAMLRDAMGNVQTLREANATGDQSELRTLQTLAIQNELSAQIMASQTDVMIKLFEMSNQGDIDRKNKQSYIYDSQLLDQLEVRAAEDYEADDSKTSTANF